MNATTRKTEIIKAMPSFSRELYTKSELLPELFLLQTELVNLTFNGEHAENAQLRVWDVRNHLAKLNEERGHIADELLKNFSFGCKLISENIRGEVSGNKGENKALRSIETVRTAHTVLRNIELSDGDHKTELDIIVFTSKAIFAIEVKNPARDIIIDERGNYCRINNDNIIFDKNIGEKMNDKTFLLRSVLKNAGIENPNIISMVVFTNNNITVTNNFPFIRHCYLSSLPHLIDNCDGAEVYTEDTISRMANSVEKAKICEGYAPSFDVDQFKQNFAELLVALENIPTEVNENPVKVQKEKGATLNTAPLWLKRVGMAMAFAPVAGLLAMATLAINRPPRK